MIRFVHRVGRLLAERGASRTDLQRACGVNRKTLYRGPQRKQTIAATAYYFGISAEELVAGTDVEDLWYRDTSEY